ncbi:hypothetical protein NKJ88_06160 [Mesorhizobium sp. M0016]|uniref:hypothetical protein n=1 Tax=Mesorhizobium sp. M0016 TaxID=2956843 RepID=UPI0033359671
MALNPLTRTAEEYVEAMSEWLTCKKLTNFETALISILRDAAAKSIGEFDEARAHMMRNYALVIWNCVSKGRAEGLCKEWKKHAEVA